MHNSISTLGVGSGMDAYGFIRYVLRVSRRNATTFDNIV